MRKQWLLLVLFSLGCSALEGTEAEYPELRLAPYVTSAENLAFTLAYGEEAPKACQRLIGYTYGVEGTRQEAWKIHARRPQPCPERFEWGQEMGADWEVLTAASQDLEPNRLYTLRVFLEGGGGRDLDFCIFQDGSVFVDTFGSFNDLADNSAFRRQQRQRCQEA